MATKAQSSIVIREIEQVAELREVEEFQKEVWGIEDREVFPALAMIPIRDLGGVLIGAFCDGQMVGFVFGFPGYESGRVILHSDMLAVRPEYRGRDIGYKLKLAQREKTLANGIETITWTFDPLQSLNAHLNFAKLGVTADLYRINYYGETSSFLHRTGTDRLWVTWKLNSERVKKRIEHDIGKAIGTQAAIRALIKVGDDAEPVCELALDEPSDHLIIEIPDNINDLLQENPESAIRWREATREAFTQTLNAGYFVEEFCREERRGHSVGVYLLSAKRAVEPEKRE